MHFAHQHPGSGSKLGKFGLVAGLHALVAVGVIHMMNTKTFPLPTLVDTGVIVELPIPKKPEPPVEPPKPTTQVAPPDIVLPKTEVVIDPPLIADPVRTTTEPVTRSDPSPQTQTEVTQPPEVKQTAKPGGMRSAVLADANSCAKPNYPAAAARNGDSGTVILALLVGTNGRVSDARVTRSSGYRDLDKAAVNALSLCQFKPAMNDGVPEAGWAQIAYVWSLED